MNENIEVGTIYYSSWGYDQTNVDFYRVVKRTPKTISLAKIRSRVVPDDGVSPMAGYKEPDLDPLDGGYIAGAEVLKNKRLREGGAVRIESYAYAYPWDGRPKYTSWYA